MELNGFSTPIGRPPQGNPCTFYLETDSLEAVAALDGQPLRMTHAGEPVASYADYRITCVRWEREGLAAVTAERAIDPDTKGAIERLESMAAQLSHGQAAQEGVNTDLQEQIDIQGDVIEMILGGE